VARTCMPAGQGVGGIEDVVSAREIVDRVIAEAQALLKDLARFA
jgi:NAD(P)H-dependent flavin oxidoreductase YrpB (nitropropane dioxygenase family)